MKPPCLLTSIAVVVLTARCASPPNVQTARLHCSTPFKARSFIGLCSFATGEVALPVEDGDRVDICYYFDGDDCAQGALMPAAVGPGHLFLIGHKDWRELAALEPPSDDAESVAAILPLTKEQSGLAFWVKTSGGAWYLARIKRVQPASYADLSSGRFPTLAVEWRQY